MHLRRAGLVCIAIVVFVGTLLFGKTASYRYVEYKIYDALFHARDAVFPSGGKKAVSVIVGIDRATLAAYPEPVLFWDKELSAAVEAVSRAKPGAIGFDILHLASIDSKRYNFGKMRIGGVLMSTPRMVLPYTIDGDDIGFPVYVSRHYRTAFGMDGQMSAGVKLKLMMLAERTGVVTFGFANLEYDDDGIVRNVTLYDYSAKTRLESFPLKMWMRHHEIARPDEKVMRTASGVFAGDRKIPAVTPVNFIGPPGTIPMVPLVEVNTRSGDDQFLRKNFEGKVVIFGAYDPSMGDVHNTPYVSSSAGITRGMYGSEIVANAVNTLAEDRFISKTGATGVVVLCLFCVAAGTMFSRKSISRGLFLYVILLVAFFAVDLLSFSLSGHVVSPLPIAGLSASFFIGYLYSHYLIGRDRQLLRTTLSSYIDPAIVDRVISESGTEILRGRRRDITVLFSDIRNFTALSESRGNPEEVVGILNVYFPVMSSVIREYEGCVDKFIGDGIMAFWNAPHDVDDHASKAVHCAREMIRKLADVNAEARSLGLIDDDLKIGIGIHTGPAIVGNVGSEVKNDYTAIGDTVNTASRLEGKTKDLGIPIVISEATRAAIGRQSGLKIDAAGSVQVKGKTRKIRVYGVRCD